MVGSPRVVALVFTDIEGSSPLWDQHGQRVMEAMEAHNSLLREACEAWDGEVIGKEGDAFFVVFGQPGEAIAFALEAQEKLAGYDWGAHGFPELLVRMGLHYGETIRRGGDHYGSEVNRTARICTAGHGGQILASAALLEAVGEPGTEVVVTDLARHRLRGLAEPQHLFQLTRRDWPRQRWPVLRTLDEVPTNLPAQVTRFVGREQDLQRLGELLGDDGTRLITLAGPGGSGKSRLAQQAAAAALEHYPDGVFWVELAGVASSEGIAPAIMQVLKLQPAAPTSPVEQLADHLHDREMLLALDNFEHVMAAADLVGELVRRAPKLNMLVTSREVLHLPGEHVQEVSPLALPTPPINWETLSQFESVQLFVDRATSAQDAFSVTQANAGAVAEICMRLDGIPLALELAAAWVRAFTPEQILAQLGPGSRVLTSRVRGVAERQRTLREAMEWSYRLLAEEDRAVFARLSAFREGFFLDAGESVCGEDAVDSILNLHDKSLLYARETLGQQRYYLLETVREFAAEKLREAGEEEEVMRRHGAWFAALAEQAALRLAENEQGAWADRVEAEGDNLDQAFEWSLTAGDPSTAARLAETRSGWWHASRPFDVFKQWTEKALAGLGDSYVSVRARVLWMAAGAAHLKGDGAEAVRLAGESLRLASELGDEKSTAYATMILGHEALRRGDYREAQDRLSESLALGRELKEHKCLAYSLNGLGNAFLYQGDYQQAKELHEQALAYARECKDWRCTAWAFLDLGTIAYCEGNYQQAAELYDQCFALGPKDKLICAYGFGLRADTARCQGEHARAADLYAKALPLLHAIGDKPELTRALEGVAKLAHDQQEPRRAALLLGAAEALREKTGAPVPPCSRDEYDRHVADVRTALGEEGFAAAWAEGRLMALDVAIAEALETARPSEQEG